MLEALETHVTELTPPGAGGVSVLELRGPGVLGLLASWGCAQALPGQLKFSRLSLAGEVLDEALVCVFSPLHAEVHIHGSRPLVRRFAAQSQRAQGQGLRSGADGPTRRSVTERATLALAHAPCELAARVLLDQVEGAWAGECARLAKSSDAELAKSLAVWSERSARLRYALEPARVLLAGPVNAGKSTLFNVLVGEERAITSEVEGTTRDLICERVQFGPWPVDLVDSAGERALDLGAAQSQVEHAGQLLARSQAARSDWILWLSPGSSSSATAPGRESLALKGPPMTVLATCKDRPGADPKGISALQDPAQAAARVSELFQDALGLRGTPWEARQPVAIDEEARCFLRKLQGLSPDLAREQLLQ